jgi:hypothetical protein
MIQKPEINGLTWQRIYDNRTTKKKGWPIFSTLVRKRLGGAENPRAGGMRAAMPMGRV